jgi:hypothetical protein
MLADKIIIEVFKKKEVTPAKADDYDNVYFDEKVVLQSDKVDGTSDCSYNNDSKEEMPDDSNNNEYNRYSRSYNKYSKRNRGYYYHDGRYERSGSPMMSPILLLSLQ